MFVCSFCGFRVVCVAMMLFVRCVSRCSCFCALMCSFSLCCVGLRSLYCVELFRFIQCCVLCCFVACATYFV